MPPHHSELGGLVPPFAELAGKSACKCTCVASKVSSRGVVCSVCLIEWIDQALQLIHTSTSHQPQKVHGCCED
jgi:hypothetical protein